MRTNQQKKKKTHSWARSATLVGQYAIIDSTLHYFVIPF